LLPICQHVPAQSGDRLIELYERCKLEKLSVSGLLNGLEITSNLLAAGE